MKLFCTIIMFIIFTINVSAVPADRRERSIIQPDGKWVTIRQFGDEYVHFLMTTDGFLVQENERGNICYATYNCGILSSTDVLAHNLSQRSKKEKKYLAEREHISYDKNMLDSIGARHRHLRDAANAKRNKTVSRILGNPTRYVGHKKGLVILVNFANREMSSNNANQDYNRMFNEFGYTSNNHVGSVHDYFFDQSYGQLNLTFDVVGPVTVSRNYGYYGSDSMSGYTDMNVSEMIIEACRLADDFVDYRNYDWNADGVVDQIYIIYAGYGQATGGAKNTIWPHESYLSEDIVLDGLKVSQYACSNELYGSAGSKKLMMGIGTACHEFSHCLGLPDLYDTDYSGAFGMSYWGVMNSGSYNGPNGIGEVPCGYTAFERWFAGWLDFIDVETSQRIDSIPCLEKTPYAYRLINEGNTNEYYTLENRQPNKWFKYVNTYEGLHGLLVTHIDYDFQAWSANRINPSPSHQRMSPIVADNSYGNSYSNLAGDLFPGEKNVTEFTNTSHTDYGGKLFNMNWDGTYCMNKSILNIQEDDGLISFDIVFNHEIPTPVALEATDVYRTSFRAVWESTLAESYAVELTIIKKTEPLLYEKIIIDDILQNEYVINDIDAVSCNYRVRANKGDLHTEWSNTIRVDLSNAVGISDVLYDKIDGGSQYNLSGQPVNDKYRGVTIQNGKKRLYR